MKKNLETSPKRGASVLKARRDQRTRMQQELACLSPFLTEWFWQHDVVQAPHRAVRRQLLYIPECRHPVRRSKEGPRFARATAYWTRRP